MIRSIDTFNETAHQLFPDDNNNDNGNDNFQLVMIHSKKAFRNKLKNYLNIVYGMQRDKRYDYLFQEIDGNMEKKIDFSCRN